VRVSVVFLLPAAEERLSRYSKRICRALHLSGYARMDFRLRADGRLYLLEANCNPNLGKDENFAAALRDARHVSR
jgi:D-alanine-D-alanine ligase